MTDIVYLDVCCFKRPFDDATQERVRRDTFPMFEKLVTKRGSDQSPIYTFLWHSGSLPAWNFSEYLVDKTGKVVAFFPSKVTPEDGELRAAFAKALAG